MENGGGLITKRRNDKNDGKKKEVRKIKGQNQNSKMFPMP